MKTVLLAKDEVLAAYDEVRGLYPHIPPLAVWRSWELAGYRRFDLPGPVLDVGCGDGRYFRLAWPHALDVVGVDIDPETAARARETAVYREVHVAPAHQLPFGARAFASAFANCALEHMDELPTVLRSVRESLRPGGHFLCSVVTEKFVDWAPLPLLLRRLGDGPRADELRRQHAAYHHLVNPLPAGGWIDRLREAGFDVEQHVPIVPGIAGRLIVLFDQLWHVPDPGGGELGSEMHRYFHSLPNFPEGLRDIVSGLLTMEKEPETGCGAIFLARRPA